MYHRAVVQTRRYHKETLDDRFEDLEPPAARRHGRRRRARGPRAGLPHQPVRIIAPFPAGSGPDANAREIAAELTKILGQSFFVENRPGASNIIGTEVAAKAPADGYSLYIGTTSSP